MKDTFPEIKEQKDSDKSGFKVPLKVMVLMHTYNTVCPIFGDRLDFLMFQICLLGKKTELWI